MNDKSIKLNVLAFASVRDRLQASNRLRGSDQNSFQCMISSTKWCNVRSLRQHLCHQVWPELSDIECSIALALNLCYLDLDQSIDLQSNDQLALIPPISGG
ncbi:hypothetical protein RDWZM_002216 [Blomia tropicalis]|uniref:Molybdopterin synthase sulfur carrier subunit n=1 Tax=Blomia tropicalis TaxID=40697 RepID=A0A9Q0RRE8_BLOTA|nr:Molybdopterin synthase catalytic subunit [Blomia tropicalis]KAJ6223671.1 hypothetical protein RDWZM_002216 [Blomia tropicalis]